MHIYDNLFFDAFKQLEQQCKQSYPQQEYGVTAYIENMANTSSDIAAGIPNWKDDYYKLLHCRHIRNQLAHESVSSTNPLSTAEDLSFLQDFCARLSNQTDPLSLVGAQSEDQPQFEEEPIYIMTPPTPPPSPSYTPSGNNSSPPRKPGCFSKFFGNSTAVLLGCGCGVPVILLIILAILGFLVQKYGW